MGNAITSDHVPEGVSTDIGRFAIVPLWLVRRCNGTKNGAAALSVFIALHEWADRDRPCYPSVGSIAEQAGISTPTASRGIKTLQELGALTVTARYVPGTRERTSSLYRMHHAEPSVDRTSPQIRGDRSSQIRGDLSYQIRSSNKNNLEREQTELENTSTLTHETTTLPALRQESESETFAAWWSQYPRKTAKAGAERAWRKLRPADRTAALNALPEHVRAWRLRGTATEYVPHPATWLNGRRWEDDLTSTSGRKVNPVMAALEDRFAAARLRETVGAPMPELSYDHDDDWGDE